MSAKYIMSDMIFGYSSHYDADVASAPIVANGLAWRNGNSGYNGISDRIFRDEKTPFG